MVRAWSNGLRQRHCILNNTMVLLLMLVMRFWAVATYHFDDDVRCRSLGVFGDASSKDWLN